jgi:hypothetical protein
MGIRDRPVSARGSIHGNVLITSSSLASAIFATFSHRTQKYYNEVRTHAPCSAHITSNRRVLLQR